MPRAEPALPARHAIALGLLHGPTELLPVSSSAHVSLAAWLAGWPYASLDGESRKSFELALHAGAGAALVLGLRRELLRSARGMDRRRLGVLALSIAPPAAAGLAFRRRIAGALGTPRSIAVGLIAGSAAMAVADLGSAGVRECADARPRDGLALGVGQALALVPGVSRSGAALTAARARGFTRGGAHSLSWHAALPVILGASALEAVRTSRPHARSATPRDVLLLGAGTAFLSTLASIRLLLRGSVRERSLLPYALYRCALATLVLRRARRVAA